MKQIGIDLGGSKTEGVVMDAQGEILQRLRYPTPQSEGYQAVLHSIVDLIEALQRMQGERCSVGIGTPGSISPLTGLMRNANTVCLNGMPLKDDLEKMLGREIRAANDANCFALSEAIDGAAKDQVVVFGVIIGTGTGGGLVVNQQLVMGAQGIAGEWGHNPLGDEGRACYCGRQDCVETYLSGSGLLQTYENISRLRLQSVQELILKWDENEEEARAALNHYHQHLGRALASVINIIDPDVVVLGGGLSNIESLYRQGTAAIMQHVFCDRPQISVLRNHHGDSSGVRGAARLWPGKTASINDGVL